MNIPGGTTKELVCKLSKRLRYLSPELHRRLKIRAAIDAEPMSELAEHCVFYLAHPEWLMKEKHTMVELKFMIVQSVRFR